MNMLRTIGLWALLLIPLAARAEEQAPSGHQAGLDHPLPVVPTLRLSGDLAGKSTFDAGMDLLVGLPKSSRLSLWDLQIFVGFQLATDKGVGQLFKLKGGELGVGSTGSFRTIISLQRPDQVIEYDTQDPTEEMKKNAATKCIAVARAATPQDTAKIAKYQALSESPASINPSKESEHGDLCDEGSKLFFDKFYGMRKAAALDKCIEVAKKRGTASEVSHYMKLKEGDAAKIEDWQLCKEGREAPPHRFPKYLISLGASLGWVENAYYEKDPVTMLLREQKPATNLPYSAALSYAWIPTRERLRGLTLEVPLLFSSRWSASQRTARNCADSVKSEKGMAQECSDVTLDAPTNKLQLWTTLQLGYVDHKAGLWRATLGPTVSYEITKEELALGFQAPLYFNAATGLPGYEGKYTGLVRIMPSFTATRTDMGWGAEFTVQFALLGQRLMFSRALEWGD